MGQVTLERGTRQREDDGTTYITSENRYITYNVIYRYCDRCGSFRLKKYYPLSWRLTIGGLALIAFFAGIPAFKVDFRNVGWVLCVALPAALLCLYFIVTKKVLRCVKCGNAEISSTNSKNYPLYDFKVLDVEKHNAEFFTQDE